MMVPKKQESKTKSPGRGRKAETKNRLAPKKVRRPDCEKVTIEMITEALEASAGLITPVIERFKKVGIEITRQAIQDRIKSNPELQAIVSGGNELRNDDAVTSLHRAIRNGEGWAVCFQLKCLGKDRGYIEKQIVDANVNANITAAEPVRVVFEYPDNGRLTTESAGQK